MRTVLQFVVLALVAIQAQAEDIRRIAIVPWADEETVTERDIEAVKERIGEKLIPDEIVSSGGTTTILIGSQPPHMDLIRYHGCPEWVAHYYKNDAKALARMLKGYRMQRDRERYNDEEFANHLKFYSAMPPHIREQDYRYFKSRYQENSRYRLMKVVENY